MLLTAEIVILSVLGILAITGGVLWLIKWFQQPSPYERQLMLTEAETKKNQAQLLLDATALRQIERELRVDELTPLPDIHKSKDFDYIERDDYKRRKYKGY